MMPEGCIANTVDPERLLAWGNSQLQKIEKERKQKKSNPEVENCSNLTNKKRHTVEYSYTERKQTKVFKEYSEEKQEILNTRRLKGKTKSFDSGEMKESEDLVHASKKKKRKKDKCELVSVNIELKKRDISYETNFSKSNKKKSKKRNYESSNDEVRKMKKKKKDRLSESDGNLNKSYVMCIKLTESDILNTTARDSVNKGLKLKNKKKTNVYSNGSERQGGNLETEQNELSPPKKKKKHKKDIYEKSSKEESNSETSDPNESISKKKKMRDSYSIEHECKKILSDVNEIQNEDDVNMNISVHTKKDKSKKRTVPSENGEADSPTVHKKKKKKNKEKTDNEELNTSSEVIYISDTSSCSRNHKEENISIHTKKEKSKKRTVPSENGEADSPTVHKKKKKKNKEKTNNGELNTSSKVVYISDTSSCSQNHNEKKKEMKIAEIMEGTSSEIYAKKKKNKKREKNMESLDDNNSVFSISCVSTCSSKTEKTGKLGINFGKSAISRLLTNRESCNACCEMNTDCSRKICNNDSIISTSSETNTKDNNQEEPNKEVNNSQVETIQNSLVTIKQEKIDTEVQNYLPANITIKQEKIDEPPLNNPTDICGEMTALNQNVQVKQEVMSTEHSSNHGEKNENVSEANVNHENGTHETANVRHDNVNVIPVLISSCSGNTESGDNINSTNDCLSENQNRQTSGESKEQYYMDSCESYYNFCDNKLTIHEEIGVCNEAQNHNNSSSEIKIEKRLEIMNNEEILEKEFPHDVNYEADVSHPNQNIYTADCVINSEQVSNEEICHNYGVTNIEDNDISHNITANNKDIIEKSLGLNYIPLSNVEQHNQADTSINIRTVHQESSELCVTVNQFHSHQYYQSPTGNEFQSEQHYQNPIENEYHYHQTNLTHKKNDNYQESHKSRYFNKCQSYPLNKSVLFSCIRPQFKMKEQVARLLHVDISQVEFCYYRMNSKYCQDVHVKFSAEKQFQKVIRRYANRVRCRSWHIKEDKRSNVKDAYKKRNSRPSE